MDLVQQNDMSKHNVYFVNFWRNGQNISLQLCTLQNFEVISVAQIIIAAFYYEKDALRISDLNYY